MPGLFAMGTFYYHRELVFDDPAATVRLIRGFLHEALR